jgi:hypothetical protein
MARGKGRKPRDRSKVFGGRIDERPDDSAEGHAIEGFAEEQAPNDGAADIAESVESGDPYVPYTEDRLVDDSEQTDIGAVEQEAGERAVELDADGARALLGGIPASTGELPSIELPTAHHFAITRIAIEQRAESLKKLASKTSDEGYPREARVIAADAQALNEDVLPQFRDQAELPLASYDDVRFGIQNLLRGNVWKHVQQAADDQVDHRNLLLDVIGSKVAQLLIAVAERSYTAGFRAREETPEFFALKSLAEITG